MVPLAPLAKYVGHAIRANAGRTATRKWIFGVASSGRCSLSQNSCREFGSSIRARKPDGPLLLHMKLRKRDKIVVLFWLPFWTLTAASVAGIGWVVGLVRLH